MIALSPFQQAAAVYDREPCARSFAEDLELHLLNGWVASSPGYFVMARPVPSAADLERVRDPAWLWPAEDCDAWWIYLAAGDLAAACRCIPFPLEFMGFERKNQSRFLPFGSAVRRLSRARSARL